MRRYYLGYDNLEIVLDEKSRWSPRIRQRTWLARAESVSGFRRKFVRLKPQEAQMLLVIRDTARMLWGGGVRGPGYEREQAQLVELAHKYMAAGQDTR